MAIPEEEEHKKIIQKNIKFINTMLLISIFLLVCILVFNKNNNSNNQTLYIFFILIIHFLTFYFCNINWNQLGLVSLHYIYIFILFISFFCNNICIISYFIFLIISNLYIWYVNTDCIFGGLYWGYDIIDKIGETTIMGLPIIYIYKFTKLFNNINCNNINDTNKNNYTNNDKDLNFKNIFERISISDIINNEKLINNIIPEKLFENELFEILHKKFS